MCFVADTMNHGVISHLYSVPAFVSIHSVESAGNGGYLCGSVFNGFFQLCDIFYSTGWSSVATVCESVDINLVEAELPGHLT